MNPIKKNSLFSRDWLNGIALLLVAVALAPQFIISPQGTGVDFGYMEALSWIWAHKLPLTFGTDIVYTYGPLGFLCYKVALNWNQTILIFIFDIYIFINGIVIANTFLRLKSLPVFVVTFLTLLFFNKQFAEPVFYLIFLFSAFQFIKTNNYRYLINAAIISLLCFFIKVNFGLLQLIVIFCTILYSFWKGKTPKTLLLTITISVFILFAILCIALHVNAVHYILSSISIISGYTEAMQIPVSVYLRFFQFAVVILVSYNMISLFYWYKSKFSIELLLRYLLTSLFIFLEFKYAFVRSDKSHAGALFICLTAATGIQYLFETGNYQRRLKEMSVICFFWAGAVFLCLNPILDKPELYKDLSGEFFKDVIGKAKNKFVFLPQIEKDKLMPERILNKIGNGTVDLIPDNLSLVFINKLHYCPRPTLQSISAYNLYLDSLNCKKYISAAGPRFVLFSCNSIDDRHPFWDESITRRAISQYYTVIDSFYVNDSESNGYKDHDSLPKEYLVFEKNAEPLSCSIKYRRVGELSLNEPFMVDTGLTPQYMYASFEYTLLGKIKNFFFQPTIIYAIVTYENAKVGVYRIPRPMAETGFLINKKVTNTNEADIFFKTDGAESQKVKSIKFIAIDKFSFKTKIKYRTESIAYYKK